jgi:hypothetical protein
MKKIFFDRITEFTGFLAEELLAEELKAKVQSAKSEVRTYKRRA